ncbi:replication factor C large subunit [Tubulinosema ratisbonensis]|nr:replication factor C large subunit [Tubulinosema ratisbonensis]
MIWAEKYSPKKFTELLFSTSVHFESLKWIKDWCLDSPILVLAGPTGHSKSLLVKILANMTNRRLFFLTSHSFKSEKYAYVASNIRSLKNEERLILIEDVDDSLIRELTKNKKKYKVPIVITLPDKYNSLLNNQDFYVLEVKKLTTNLVLKRINEISKSENISFNQKDLLNFIEKSNCDLRSILNTLQVYKRCVNLSKIKIKN